MGGDERRTVRKPGAIVRKTCDTTSAKVATMEAGEQVHVVEEDVAYATNKDGETRMVMRARIEYPVDGWLSLKCLEGGEGPDDGNASFTYKDGKVKKARRKKGRKKASGGADVEVVIETDESDGGEEPAGERSAARTQATNRPPRRLQGMNAFARAATENLHEARGAPSPDDTPASKHIAALAARVLDGKPSLYDALGVASRAEAGAIKRSYRALAKVHHPDRSSTAASAAAMVELNDAYEVLSDPTARRAYDERLDVLIGDRDRASAADAAFADARGARGTAARAATPWDP